MNTLTKKLHKLHTTFCICKQKTRLYYRQDYKTGLLLLTSVSSIFGPSELQQITAFRLCRIISTSNLI